MIYTTNSIESLNYQMRKVIKNRGQFPNDASVVILALAGDLQHRRTNAPPSGPRNAVRNSVARHPGCLVEGQVVTNWKKALEQLSLVYPDRIERYL